MRALFGLLLLLAVALGFEQVTGRTPGGQGSGSAAFAAMPQPAPPRGPVFQTVATVDTTLPQVEAAPGAPRAAPIDPIVTPIPKSVPKTPAATAPAKGKSAPAKGFKLSCTSSQKLDAAKKKCIPLKGTAAAGDKRV